MTSLNPDYTPESWKDVFNFIIQVYFFNSKLLFGIALSLAILFCWFVLFFIYPRIGLGVC